MMQHAEPVRSTAVRSPAVLRRCACGGGGGALGECAACRRAKRRDATLRRQEGGAKPKSNEEKITEAAKKTGEAFLETGVGKDLKKKAEELGKGFVSSLAGKVITGAAAAGVVTYIVAKNKELPVGVPDIPLDAITPGLKATITYDGPVRSPTKAMVTFTWSPGAPAKKPSKQPTEKEKFRAETARMAKEQADFRESMKSPAERAEEKEMFWKAYWGGMDKYGIRPLNIPALDQEKKEEGTVRRSAEGASPAVAPAVVHDTLARGGAALPGDVRSRFESRFGHDFGHVRIHTDARAADSAAAVNALAYTAGEHVVFGTGRFSPRSAAGERLLAHELAHVVQQDTGRDTGGTGAGLEVGRADDPQEAAADALAHRALHGAPAVPRPRGRARPGGRIRMLRRFTEAERGEIGSLTAVIDNARTVADTTGAAGLMRWGRFTAGVTAFGGWEAIAGATGEPSVGSRARSLPSRYLYTCQCGLVDLRHFYQMMYIALLEGNRAATEEGREHELTAELTSRFAPEDTPSNALGALFGSRQSYVEMQSTFVSNLSAFLTTCAPVDFTALSTADQDAIVAAYGARAPSGAPARPRESALPERVPIAGCRGRTGMFPFVLAAGDADLKTLSGEVSP